MEQLYALYLQSKGISTDSRNIIPGSLFFALKGERFNGNEYALDALAKGAKYVIIDEAKYQKDARCILVDDVLKKLQELAAYHRRKLGLSVLAITGTNGKTTSKELIAAVLSKKFKVLYTQGNLNNHIGVPLTLLQLTESHDIAVIEMGASKPGDIKELCEIADPDMGIITNIGKAHLEGFGSPEGVIQTKTELYRYIDAKNGVIFFNEDDECISLEVQKLSKVGFFSYGVQSSYCKGLIKSTETFLQISLFDDETHYIVQSNLVGEYNFYNILSAACIGKKLGICYNGISSAIENYFPDNKRSQVKKTSKNTLVLDCYNANPTSMQAAINSFMANKNWHNKVFILGDMLELGIYADDEHRNIINMVANETHSKIYFVGKQFFKNKIYSKALFFETTEHIIDYLRDNPIIEATVLLKGSRGIQLEKLEQVL